MDSPVPDVPAGADGDGEDEEEDDAEALKAHIAKMKAGGDTSAGNGEVLARSVKCSEVRLPGFVWGFRACWADPCGVVWQDFQECRSGQFPCGEIGSFEF